MQVGETEIALGVWQEQSWLKVLNGHEVSMGAALAGLAAEEAIGMILIVAATAVGGALALAVIDQAVRNCPCDAAPVVVQTESIEIKLMHADQLSAQDLMSAMLKGNHISNSAVPYRFSLIVGKGFGQQRTVYHAGIMIIGKFKVNGEDYDHLLAERWLDSVTIRLYQSKQKVLERFRLISVHEIPLTDCDETPLFTSKTPAPEMVEYVREDLGKTLEIANFRSERDLSNPRVTNCIAFGIRGGMLLAGPDAENFLRTCQEAIHGN